MTRIKALVAAAVLAVVCTMTMKAQTLYTRTFSMDDIKPNAAGWSYWFIPTGGVADTLNVKISCVTKGDAPHGAHRHNHHELFIALEGDSIVNLNGEDRLLHPGDALFCPGGSSHSIRRADLSKQSKYLMLNTDTPGGLPEPLPFWKETYTADDCHTIAGEKSFWYLRPEQTLHGLNAESVLIKGRKVNKNAADGHQLVYIIMEGSANISVDGETVTLPAMSVCYVPAGASSTIASFGKRMRYIAVRTH